MLLANSIVEILAAGGGLIVDAGNLLAPVLVQMASAAHQGGCTLTIRNCGALLVPAMKQIAAAGGGHVIFDLTA